MTEHTAGLGSPEMSSGAPGSPGDDGHVPAPASRRLEIVAAGIGLVLSLLLFVYAQQIELRAEIGGIDPRWWPRTIGMLGIGFSAVLLLIAVLRDPPGREESEAATRTGQLRLLLAVGLAVAYMILWPLVGFLPTTLALLVAATAVFGGRSIGSLVIFPVCTTAALYLVFDVGLKVPL